MKAELASEHTGRVPPPSDAEQLVFLQKLQRIFDEGEFVATYKFALLIALAEIAIEQGEDDGSPLTIRMHDIAEKFVELYWRQVAPYRAAPLSTGDVLAQNTGAQAAVVSAIAEARRSSETLAQVRRAGRRWSDLLARVARVVRAQPIRYLQNVGGGTDSFLYDIGPQRGEVRLRRGVVFCLRRFQPLVVGLARAGWVRHVRELPRNRYAIGEAGDLEAFLFGESRAALADAAKVLSDLQRGHCFYCRSALRLDTQVDHFVPWARYPRDLAHNLVLSCPACNRRKSDALAARRHLECWLERNGNEGAELGSAMQAAGVLADAGCALRVAQWAYGQAVASGASGWVSERSFEAIDARYSDLLK